MCIIPSNFVTSVTKSVTHWKSLYGTIFFPTEITKIIIKVHTTDFHLHLLFSLIIFSSLCHPGLLESAFQFGVYTLFVHHSLKIVKTFYGIACTCISPHPTPSFPPSTSLPMSADYPWHACITMPRLQDRCSSCPHAITCHTPPPGLCTPLATSDWMDSNIQIFGSSSRWKTPSPTKTRELRAHIYKLTGSQT